MKLATRLAVAAATACVGLVFAGPALATPTVCASGCLTTSIQSAIATASPGATITIGKGNYYENVVVNKSVTLKGAGAETVIYPAVSNPACSGGSLCGGAASNIVLVEASNVTITNLRLEGANPNLASEGVEVGGKKINARNGIITNHLNGVPYSNLVVSRVKVSDVYLRGIYASTSGGSFNFNHDTVENVQAEEQSIAMFSFENSGVFAHNKVSNANDAISSNWSKGIEFLSNVITKSGSGVHTDNDGGAGGTADLIKGNTVRECKSNGYGIFVFVPYVSATVEANRISGCAVGLGAYGGAVSGQGPTFKGNIVNGTGAATTGATYGAYLTTDQLGFEYGNLTATVTGNSFSHFDTGLFVTQSNPTPGQPAGGQATVNASGSNSFVANGSGAVGEPGTSVNGKENWWGCAAGPNKGHACNTALGTVEYEPFLTARP